MGYWQLLQQYPAFLRFGFLATFASSFGQTFFISPFVDDTTRLHQLSYGNFGTLYAITTAAGGVFLMRVGKRLDYILLKNFADFLLIGLALPCALMALSANWIVLIVKLFGLRLFGHGLMGHMAITSMGRYFHLLHGRAAAFLGIGFPVGEIILPSLVLLLLTQLGFITTWWLITSVVCVIFWPVLIYLQKHHPKDKAPEQSTSDKTATETSEALPPPFRQRDLIRDKRVLGLVRVYADDGF